MDVNNWEVGIITDDKLSMVEKAFHPKAEAQAYAVSAIPASPSLSAELGPQSPGLQISDPALMWSVFCF